MKKDQEQIIEEKNFSSQKKDVQIQKMDLEERIQSEEFSERQTKTILNEKNQIKQTQPHGFSMQSEEKVEPYMIDKEQKPIRTKQRDLQKFDISKKKVKIDFYQNTHKESQKLDQFNFQVKKYKHLEAQESCLLRSLREKAQLSSQVIEMIEKPQQPIKQKFLQQQILQLILNKNKYQKQNRKQILKFFKQGIKLNKSIYPEDRIDVSTTIVNEKTIFYPTNSFTGAIFNKLRDQKQKQIIMGHFGISKTMSTILYQQLTEFMVDYQLKQPSFSNQCSKVIYWAINIKKDTQQSISDLILQQFSEIQINYLKQFFSTKDLQSKLTKWNWKKAFSNRKINIILVVDQINCLISQIRKTKYDRTAKYNQKSDQFRKIAEIDKIITQLSQIFDKMVFLSSMNIQTYLLKQLECFDSLKMRIPKGTVILSGQLISQQGKLELIHFFVRTFFECFQIKISNFDQDKYNSQNQFFSEQQRKQNLVKSIVMKIYNSLDSSKTFYLTQLVIRSYVKQIATDFSTYKKQVQQISTVQFLQLQITKNLHLAIQKQMPKSIREKAQQFLKNTSQLHLIKSELILEVHRLYQQQQKVGNSKLSLIGVPVDRITMFKTEKKNEFLMQTLDRNLFSFDEHKGLIKVLIPPQVFINLKIQQTDQSLIDYAVNCIANLEYHTIVRGGNLKVIGEKLQYYLKLVLTIQGTSLSILDNYGKVFRQFNNIEKVNDYFIPINQNKKSALSKNQQQKVSISSQSHKHSFKNMIEKPFINVLETDNFQFLSENSIEKYCFFLLPGKKQFINKQTKSTLSPQQMLENQNHVSKDIDLMLISIQKNKKISIYALDVTIQCKHGTIRNKICKFLQSFDSFSDNNQDTITLLGKNYQLELFYFVVSPQTDYRKIIKQLSNIGQKEGYNFIKDQNLQTIYKSNHKQFKLLKEIGHLGLTNHLSVINKNNNIVDFMVYQKLAQELFYQI